MTRLTRIFGRGLRLRTKLLPTYVQGNLTQDQMRRGGFLGQVHEDGFKSGYDVVCWLEQHPEFWPLKGVRVHSANPAGAARMRQVINRHYRGEI